MNIKTFRISLFLGTIALSFLAFSAMPVASIAEINKGTSAAQNQITSNELTGKVWPGSSQKNFRQKGVETILLAGSVKVPAKEATGREVAQASMADSEITQVTTEEGTQGEAIITIESSQAIQYTAFKLLNPLRLVLDFTKMGKGSLTDRIEVNKGVVESIRPLHFEDAGVLRLEIALNRAAGYDIQKPLKNKLVIHLQETVVEASAPAPMEQKSAPAGKMAIGKKMTAKVAQESKAKLAEDSLDPCQKLLSGDKEKISLDFQDANVRNLFRIFSEISGFNLILSPEVQGSVNMRLLDVPWNQAFEIILANSGLGRQCLGGNIIRVASQQVLANEEQAQVAENNRKAEKTISEKLAAELVTEVLRINYADIKEVAANLDAQKTGRGRVTVDVRTNTLILTDIRETVDDMANLIRVLDVQTPQVMIEARIVEVNKSVSQQLGVQWGLSLSQSNGNTTIDPATNATSPFLVDLLPGGSALAAGATSGVLVGLDGLADGLNLDAQLTALEKKGDARILSSPKVTTLDNKEARIKSGRSIPFQTSSANEGTKIEFVDAELSLTVTPHITSDDNVYMVIDATKNAANPANLVAGFPEITTKEAHTEVLVENGDTTVLGGIYESEVKRNKESVPFLSKIPILGAIFRNFDDEDSVDELLIFITPTILTNDFAPNS